MRRDRLFYRFFLNLRWSRLSAIACLILAGCSAITEPTIQGPGWYRVKPSDTLYSIAWRYGLDYRELAQWNGLGDPYRIYPGQQLILLEPEQVSSPTKVAGTVPPKPKTTTKTARASAITPARKTPGKSQPLKSSTKSPIKTPKKTQQATAKTTSATANQPVKSWRWPTAGALLNRFSYRDLDRRGIDIAGKIGQPVYAVASGKVVYSGDGLSGYGNLIIIKHNDTFLSAYAYNQSILAKEGRLVKKGDLIAKMGQGKDKKAALHFQVRKNGKPVDPLIYLPERK